MIKRAVRAMNAIIDRIVSRAPKTTSAPDDDFIQCCAFVAVVRKRGPEAGDRLLKMFNS